MGSVWELDFYSRPVFDENNKKRWEILICEGLQSVSDAPEEMFRYSKYVSNSEVNSDSLQAAIDEAIAQATEQSREQPTKVRYFRYQMQNMIKRACENSGLLAYPSRRALALQQWLEDRQENVYPKDPTYKAAPSVSTAKPLEVVSSLPDALLGQKWSLVTLPAAAFDEMDEWDIGFGESFPLAPAGVAPDTPIPGFIVYSQRANPLAAWMSGLEIACVRAGREESSNYVAPTDGDTARLLMDTGTIETWLLADLTTPETQAEARRFEDAKAAANNVHFLAVQDSPDSESFAGFWLMQSRDFG